MASPKDISIDTFDYDLPDERIARHPLPERDQSQLLLYRDGTIEHTQFRKIVEHLPERSLLVFNDTKVIHARLYFELPSGSRLEVLCLEPLSPAEYQQNFSSTQSVRWKCLVGGNRKWKSGEIEKHLSTPTGEVLLKVSRLDRLADAFDVQFEWEEDLSFGELLAHAGIIPLPPYLQREAVPEDQDRYQTVYAREQGSVAAPTAGLHFTEQVLDSLSQKGIDRLFLTLHVGAGTFKPVKADRLEGHEMHQESVYISHQQLEVLHRALAQKRLIIAVGTTSTRLLESLYWHALSVVRGNATPRQLQVGQWAPYKAGFCPPAASLFAQLLERGRLHNDGNIEGQTQIIIAPGYNFRVISGLITNFHQPRSTLLLLIAALIGDDWKAVYDYALANDFRFLSYGDSSLLMKK